MQLHPYNKHRFRRLSFGGNSALLRLKNSGAVFRLDKFAPSQIQQIQSFGDEKRVVGCGDYINENHIVDLQSQVLARAYRSTGAESTTKF